MFQQIERQFVRTARPLYGHLVTLLEARHRARRAAVGIARCRRSATLAQRLQISRTTVVSAYRELESRGLLRGYVGRGTFVCAAPEPDGHAVRVARQDRRRGAALERLDAARRRAALVRRAAAVARGRRAGDRLLSRPRRFSEAIDHVLTRRRARGVAPRADRRAAGAARAPSPSASASPRESVLVLSGAQQGLDLLARCLIDPGDAVIIDRPGLPRRDPVVPRRRREADRLGHRARRHRRARGSARPLSAEADLHEPDVPEPDRRRRCRSGRGASCCRWRERYRVPIVEDATYRDLYFHEAPPPSLRELDDARTS